MSYVTSFERLSREEGLQQGLQQGLEEGEHRKAIAIAKNLLAEGMSPQTIQRLTGLPEKEVMDLVDKH
jgi:predicted transposase/invertase (TIGR01784 family)